MLTTHSTIVKGLLGAAGRYLSLWYRSRIRRFSAQRGSRQTPFQLPTPEEAHLERLRKMTVWV